MIPNRYSPIHRRTDNLGLTLLPGGLEDSFDCTPETVEPFSCEPERVVPYDCNIETIPFLGSSYCTTDTYRARPVRRSALGTEERVRLRTIPRAEITFMFDRRIQ